MKHPKPHLAYTDLPVARGDTVETLCDEEVLEAIPHARFDAGELPELDTRGICQRCLKRMGAAQGRAFLYCISDMRGD